MICNRSRKSGNINWYTDCIATAANKCLDMIIYGDHLKSVGVWCICLK